MWCREETCSDGHHDDCMFPLFSKIQINSDCLTFDPQSNPDWRPYLTDYIIHVHFLSEDLHCCLHVNRCFAPVTGQKSMFIYAVGCFFFVHFHISLCDCILDCSAKALVHSSSYQTWYEHWSNAVLHVLEMCYDAASSTTVITLAWSHSVCCRHKIDLVHTCNNSLARLSDWNLQGSQQSEVRMKKLKKTKHLLLKCSHLSNGRILEDGRFWLPENFQRFEFIFAVSFLLNQQGCIWPLHLILMAKLGILP